MGNCCQARRALRALKAVVRIQAIFRGRQVRNQAAVTLRCMQALVRVQARVRAQCVTPSETDEFHNQTDSTKDAEVQTTRHFFTSLFLCYFLYVLTFANTIHLCLNNFQKGWCDIPGTLEEVRAKKQMRQEGAMKRERAIAYSVLKQVIVTLIFVLLVDAKFVFRSIDQIY